MVFLGYAAFVAVPVLVLAPKSGRTLTTVQVALSFVTFVALLVAGRWRWTFQLARLTLALWALRGVEAAIRIGVVPWFFLVPAPQPLLVRLLMIVGAAALCGLFWLYGFGRGTRAFYGW
jgi:hypothetical protein